jgi:cellulose synthase (UDP-forming)
VTDVAAGTTNADAHAQRNIGDDQFSTITVGNSEIGPAAWILDDLLAPSGEREAGSADLSGSARAQRRPAPPRPASGNAVQLASADSLTARPADAVVEDRMTQPLPAVRKSTAKIAPLREVPPADKPAPRPGQPAGKLRVAPPPSGRPTPQLASTGQGMPTPPLDEEKYRYNRRYAWLVTVLGVGSFPLLMYGQIRMMLHYHWFWLYSPFLFLTAIFLAMPLLTDAIGRGFDFDAHKRLVASWKPARYPSVDVFLPVCGEPIDVLRNTWHYVAVMGRHYQGTVTAYVLDDSHSPELKAMAREFGFVYATRPNRGWFKKSGNLWFGYQVSYGEFIMLLDADFAPRHDFLDETVPYMDSRPELGILQTPQFFHVTDDQTWVERGAGATQELFYRSIQSARARKGGAICVGSCAVYRREALKENLGMTLAEHSEDMLTGYDLKAIGWGLHYIPVALSTGNCPDNVLAFLNQQYRWCAGTVDLLTSAKFWSAKLSLYTRICFASGLIYYIYSSLFLFFMPAITIAILICLPKVLLFKNMIFMVPVIIYGSVVFPGWHHAPFRLESWSARLISEWAHFFAYWDAIRGKRLGWKPSGSAKQDGGRRFWACFIIWSVGSSAVWTGLALYRMISLNPLNFIVLFGLGLFELLIAARVLLQPATDAHA